MNPQLRPPTRPLPALARSGSRAPHPVRPASCSERPGWRDGRAWVADGQPRGREQNCQVRSCCLASFSQSFNVHSSRISESSQHQLSSDLFFAWWLLRPPGPPDIRQPAWIFLAESDDTHTLSSKWKRSRSRGPSPSPAF